MSLLPLSCGHRGGEETTCDTSENESVSVSDTENPDESTDTSEIPNTSEIPDTSEIDTSVPDTTVPSYPDSDYTYEIDIDPYLQYICPEDDTEYLVIANRKHPLGKDYVPKDLVKVAEGQTWKLCRAAKEAFEAMRLEMEKLGVYDTYNRSTYRSYSFQSTLYNGYIERDMKRYPNLTREEVIAIVDTYSARPGTSDHQTGLTIDFNPLNESFEDLKAFEYMKDNAHKFGFILRYPEGKTNVTGYKYEPWHWRFVGRNAATYIYENGITLEEYMAEMNGTELETFS